jgi:hypothetical protein
VRSPLGIGLARLGAPMIVEIKASAFGQLQSVLVDYLT